MKTVAGKLYYISKGKKFPASFKQIVIMPNTPANLKLSQDLQNLFEDNLIVKIKGARKSSTDKDGNYELKNITPGRYIIRVTGMGGMVIKFDVPNDNNINLKIPEMPADYYYKRIPTDVYIKG